VEKGGSLPQESTETNQRRVFVLGIEPIATIGDGCVDFPRRGGALSGCFPQFKVFADCGLEFFTIVVSGLIWVMVAKPLGASA